jgi:L-iditol 2-dehydrogenase
MQAAVLEKIEDLKIKNIPVPQCKEGEILIKVESCAVCGTDVKVYHHGHKHIRFPRITGHEVSGIVEEVGRRVKGFEKGERVAVAPAVPCGECHYCRQGMQSMCLNLTAIGYHYDGGFAEYMLVPERAVRNDCVNKIPESLSFEEASLAEPLACCINGQELSGVKLGDTVVIIGAGPVGCFQAQLARAKGAVKVILIDISSKRLRMAKIAGADFYLDGSRENPVERVLKETGERGAEVVITACSSGKAQEEALEMVAPRGNVNFFGGLPKDSPYIKFNSNLPHYKEFYVVGTHGSSPRHNRLALNLIAKGQIRAKELITHRLSISEVRKGIEITEKGEGSKVIIKGRVSA